MIRPNDPKGSHRGRGIVKPAAPLPPPSRDGDLEPDQSPVAAGELVKFSVFVGLDPRSLASRPCAPLETYRAAAFRLSRQTRRRRRVSPETAQSSCGRCVGEHFVPVDDRQMAPPRRAAQTRPGRRLSGGHDRLTGRLRRRRDRQRRIDPVEAAVAGRIEIGTVMLFV